MSTFDSIRNRWLDFRPSKTQAFWLAAGAVVFTLAAGFGSGSWVTASSADKRVAQASQEARENLAASICVEEFMAASNAGERLAKLQKLTWYARSEQITEGGWATMPDRKEPNVSVAIACASRLSEMEPQQIH